MPKMCKCGILQKIARPDSTSNLVLVEANTFEPYGHGGFIKQAILWNKPNI